MMDFLILAQEIPAIPGSQGLKTTDYLIAIAMAWYVIKELLGIIKASTNKKKYNGENDRRRPDDTIMLMTQHEKMILTLDKINGDVSQIKEITKSTSNKATDIKTTVNLILDRVPRPT